jgi:beta-glucosidase
MAAYNSWNGTVMSVHPCLEEITRKQWGNNGIICTDGGALKLLVESHKAFPTLTEGAAAVVKATTGQFLDAYVPYVKEALEKGLLTEADIDKAIRGNIYVALKLGLLDGDNSENPYLSIGKNPAEAAPYTRQEAHQLAREVTAKSVVLLKNEASKVANGNKLLPLDSKKLRKIALIGPYSNKIVQDWYSGTPPYETTILSGIRNAVDKNTEILHFDDNAMGQAERAAAAADIAIVCVGNHPYGTRADWKFSPVPSDGREAVDRKSLMLPDEDLVKQVFKANPNTILVLVSSFPYTINWSQEHVPAIVHITHCSQEQGNGLADVLFGKVNPAGRTVQTWVKDITDLPDMMDYNIRHGRTYMYHKGDVLYPFGYGLSYSTFDYEKVNSVKQDKKNVNVTVSVKNTGTRDGEEVVQLYASYPNSKVERPAKQLRAFKRVPIKAGETKEVVLTVSKEDLGYWDETKQAFTVEPGTVKLLIGASSEDIKLETDTTL